VKCAARGSLKIQDAKISHLRTAQLRRAISSQLRHVSTVGKKVVKQQYLLHMPSQYGELRPTNSPDWLAGLGHPSKFQRGLRLDFDTAVMSLNGSQPNCTVFGRLLSILCVHFRGLLSHYGILQGTKFTCPSLVFSCFSSDTARHWSSGVSQNVAWYKEWNHGTFARHHFQQRAPPIFRGRPSRWA